MSFTSSVDDDEDNNDWGLKSLKKNKKTKVQSHAVRKLFSKGERQRQRGDYFCGPSIFPMLYTLLLAIPFSQ